MDAGVLCSRVFFGLWSSGKKVRFRWIGTGLLDYTLGIQNPISLNKFLS